MITEILIASQRGIDINQLNSVKAIAGSGLEGDRYTLPDNRKSDLYQVTLIEVENINRYNKKHGESFCAIDLRRNLVTQGINLNDLVGKQFTVVNEAVFEGIELCEPCSLLANRTHPSIVKGLLHRGGLRAKLIKSGEIFVGDSVC